MLPSALSYVTEYTLVDIADDALLIPVPPAEPVRLDDEPAEDFKSRHDAWTKARDEAAEEFARKFTAAGETGKWDGLLDPAKQPTTFRVRQIPHTAWDAFRSIWPTKIGEVEGLTLAFRLGVVAIANLNLGVSIEVNAPYVADDGRRMRAFGDLLSEDVVNAIARAPGGRDVVHRIGLRILQQRGAPLGK